MGQRTSEFNYTGNTGSELPNDICNHGSSIHSTRAASAPTKNNISTTEQVEAREKKVISGMEFVSVKGQLQRYYDIPTGKGGSTVRIIIKNPQWLFVRESGAHLVIDDSGETHYIPNTFVHLAWKNSTEESQARF